MRVKHRISCIVLATCFLFSDGQAVTWKETYRIHKWGVGISNQGNFYATVYTHTPGKGHSALGVKCENDKLEVTIFLDNYISRDEHGQAKNIGNVIRLGLKELKIEAFYWDVVDPGNNSVKSVKLISPAPWTFLTDLRKNTTAKEGALLVFQVDIASEHHTMLFDVTGTPGLMSDLRDHCG